MLLMRMWTAGFTPKAWKTSDTILIDKNKGDKTQVSLHRPIGLADILTSFGHALSLTLCVSTQRRIPYSAPHKLASNTKNTVHQLQNIIMAL